MLLAANGLCVSSALQALQIATSPVYLGLSGAAQGWLWMARPNGAVQRSRRASLASRRIRMEDRKPVTARGEYANVLLAAKGPCVSSAPHILQIATSPVAEAVRCG